MKIIFKILFISIFSIQYLVHAKFDPTKYQKIIDKCLKGESSDSRCFENNSAIGNSEVEKILHAGCCRKDVISTCHLDKDFAACASKAYAFLHDYGMQDDNPRESEIFRVGFILNLCTRFDYDGDRASCFRNAIPESKVQKMQHFLDFGVFDVNEMTKLEADLNKLKKQLESDANVGENPAKAGHTPSPPPAKNN